MATDERRLTQIDADKCRVYFFSGPKTREKGVGPSTGSGGEFRVAFGCGVCAWKCKRRRALRLCWPERRLN